MLNKLEALPLGFTELESKPGGTALDFIRGNLFDTARMSFFPTSCPVLTMI